MKRVALANAIRTLRVVLMIALVGLSVPAGASKGGPKDTTMTANSLSCPFAANNVCPGDGDMATRTVTTTRSTAVPCKGAVTNYWTNPTDPESWGVDGTPLVTAAVDGDGYVVEDDTTGNQEDVKTTYTGAIGETWTLSCELKAGTSTSVLLAPGNGSDFCTTFTPANEWTRYSCTKTLTTAGITAKLVPAAGGSGPTGSVYVRQCQLEKAPSAGERCDTGTCYTSSSIWQDVAANTACIAPGGVPGVESYGPVTNYWPNSTTPSLWPALGTPVVSGQTVTDDDAAGNEAVTGLASTPSAGTWTAACYVRSGTLTTARVAIVTDGTGGVTCSAATVGATAARLTCTATVGGTPTIVRGYVYPGSAPADTGSINVDQCQLVKDSTPGRRCDSGGTPTTCAADQHTVSTTGWPVASGRVELSFRPSVASPGAARVLLDTRSGATGWRIWFDSANQLRFTAQSTDTTATAASALSVTTDNRVVVTWGGGAVSLDVNGIRVGSLTGRLMPTGPMRADATIGAAVTGDTYANGTVSLVSIGEP